MGDSNTRGLKFANFGQGADATTEYKGTFGNAMPGKRVEAFCIDDLDPQRCIGYNNIVVHCGTNNIRLSDIKSNDQVRDEYTKLKTKIDHIFQVNKRIRVYVSVLLPTKLNECNKKIRYFNSLITGDLINSYRDVRVVDHYNRFTDSRGLLSVGLSKGVNDQNEPDNIHLNQGGLRLLSVNIKNLIFHHKREQQDRRDGGAGVRGGANRQHMSVSYARAATPHRGGGHNNHGWRGRRQ